MADSIAFDIVVKQSCFGVQTENKFALLGESYLSASGVATLANALITEIVQKMNLVQHEGVVNQTLICTQRGDTIFTAEVPLTDGGVSGAIGAEQLPAKFPFLIRLYTGLTFAVQDSVPQTAHPISRGMQFLSGADDRYFINGIFQSTVPESAGWADYLGIFENSFMVGGLTYSLAVLSEAVTTPPSPWTRPVSIAVTTGATLRTITQLDSRKS